MQPAPSWSQHPARGCWGQVKGAQEAKRGSGSCWQRGARGLVVWFGAQARVRLQEQGLRSVTRDVPREASGQAAIRRWAGNKRTLCQACHPQNRDSAHPVPF